MGSIIQQIFDALKGNWVEVVAALWALEKLLRLIDKILPANITVDNNIADILYKLLTAFFPKKNP